LSDLVITGDNDEVVGNDALEGLREYGHGLCDAAARLADSTSPNRRFDKTIDISYEEPFFALTDIDGDKLPDLVITGDDDAVVGTTLWKVHRNTGTGFAAQPIDWADPFHLRSPNR
jgi:hypothetical protein